MPTMARDADVAIVGAGFAGIGMAIRLRRAGVRNFIVLERARDVGGTWRDNRYPGCACDIPSLLYSFSFEPNPGWTRLYPRQDEIEEYLRACVRRNRLLPHIRFNAELREARWDDARARWRLELASGETLTCRVLVSATGALSTPKTPAIAGFDRFAGTSFHSMRWDAGVDLRGRDVAVIGTGASAVQIVPALAPVVRRLSLFQRTPAWIVPRGDREVRGARRLLRRVPGYAWLARKAIYWTLEARAYAFTVDPGMLQRRESVALRHLARQVPDGALRERLTPSYRMGCKRVLLSDDFYPSLLRENVELVTSPIREARERALVTADGVDHPADVVVFATGFAATDGPGIPVYGSDGVALADAWRDGMSAYLGTSVAGFPNFFTLIGPNTGLGHNSMVFMMEAQYRYVLSALRLLRRRRLRSLDVRADVQRRFNDRLQRRMRGTVWSSGCSSWYIDVHGRNTTLWPGFTFVFRLLTRRLRPDAYRLA